jgi:hypothetical protein
MTLYLGDTLVVEKNYGLVVSLFLFVSLAYLVVGMRVYTRLHLVRNLGIDDSLMVVAVVSPKAEGAFTHGA